jgi:RNA recognition motif-containing protein
MDDDDDAGYSDRRRLMRTIARDSEPAAAVSPLQGAKVVITNLHESVSEDDIVELFGDMGAIKRAKMAKPGTAEVVFVKLSAAAKAVETYHNRQLDGKAMKCRVVGAAGAGPK